MKALLLISASFLASTNQAATLECSTLHGLDVNSPEVHLSANVSDDYATGSDLKALHNLKVTTYENHEAHAMLAADASYRPRTNKNRARFILNGVDAATDAFDGIVHGFLLPKSLTAAEILTRADAVTTFAAMVISSTDSYHDGIMSYFRINCRLTSGN